ncbi:MAG TPA: DUF6498-containing protein [Gemmatimonadaceae bacterium]
MPDTTSAPRWSSTWPDALAFVVGLGVAWRLGWSTTDLVWSLWLSSLVVGYATIVWTIARPALAIGRGMSGVALLPNPSVPSAARLAGAAAVMLGGAMFLLAFFTVHFGMFHYIHSQFLISFFPLDGTGGASATAGPATYLEVARRYWAFLPMAFVAERAGFATAVPAGTRAVAAISDAEGRERAKRAGTSGFGAPYANVVRLHLLIFFFAGAHFAGLESFAVYSVVYAVYFFPWHVLRRGRPALAAEPSGAG